MCFQKIYGNVRATVLLWTHETCAGNLNIFIQIGAKILKKSNWMMIRNVLLDVQNIFEQFLDLITIGDESFRFAIVHSRLTPSVTKDDLKAQFVFFHHQKKLLSYLILQ